MLNTYDTLKRYLGIDVYKFIQDFVSFVDQKQGFIYAYFNGDINFVNPLYFIELEELYERSITIVELFDLNKNRFQDVSYWNVLENVDEIKVKLETIKNLDKWCRSTRTPEGFKTMQVHYIQKQNETLEKLANRVGYDDPDNKWFNIALDNSLKEEDYNKEGGFLMKVYLQNDNKIGLTTIVDRLSGENLYGLDIAKKLSFVGSDLSTLSYRETIRQSASILVGLIKGSVPEFPNDGVDKKMVSTINSIVNMYPSIIRQLTSTFKNDDTFSSISILDIRRQNDAVLMEIAINTRLGEIIKENLVL